MLISSATHILESIYIFFVDSRSFAYNSSLISSFRLSHEEKKTKQIDKISILIRIAKTTVLSEIYTEENRRRKDGTSAWQNDAQNNKTKLKINFFILSAFKNFCKDISIKKKRLTFLPNRIHQN